ncbi:DNA replication and repair protein RecN [Stella humosa]|uniref:DNA repair protein RecN n=1 Tax=Stella humosa TaxID=94 RepID=A0A3N1L3Z7_9PROT|nr:DNA repair protein RecN [Stella humosa]ROP84125.1 DNA replication and repair protein RecN [Stella humosa]BBK33635.1 DNA repair protein RecN [Stella humosa]
MLTTLSIRDIVLIDRLDLAMEPGLSALTGETGAGKSILLDALGLALGARADSGLVRQGSNQASVTAEFSPGDSPELRLVLDELGVPAEETLRLRRVLSADGRSRAFVNDVPAGVASLRRLAEMLVEVHGQFDQQSLLDAGAHRRLLDAFAGHQPLLDGVVQAHAAQIAARGALKEARQAVAKARADEEYLRQGVAELGELQPEPDEEAGLAEERAAMSQRGRLLEAVQGALAEIEGDRGAETRIAAAARLIERQSDRAGDRFEPAIAALDRALAELREAGAVLETSRREFADGGRSLEAIEDRIHALRAASRKYGVPASALPELARDFARRLELLADGTAALARAEAESAAADAGYRAAAETLGQSRRDAAARLDLAVAAELPPLKLERARFVTDVDTAPESDWGPEGTERVSFTVATNVGSAPGPLGRIASGGELSRFMLALKVVLAAADPVGTLVFDEVDSGIGGAVASAVGERLARLADSVQVMVVTHSPQVAALADCHWQVRKDDREGQTTTRIAPLDPAARREEIARMLSGSAVTDAARAAADSLMQPATGDRPAKRSR